MNSNFIKKVTLAIVALSLLYAGLAFSAEEATGEQKTVVETTPSVEEETPHGILPIPDYGQDISKREHMLNDPNGKRGELANDHGFQWDIDTVTWTDKVFEGGINDDFEFGGNLTYNMEWDLMRAGIIPGALIQMRAESRFGSSGILNSGRPVPINTAALSPTNYTGFDDGYGLALTHLTYLQMLSEKFGVIGGKFDLYGNGDMNEFAGGRGRTQFSNWSLNYGTSNLLVPASTLGVGVVFLPSKNLNIMSLLVSGTECTHSNCFNDLDDKGGISITSATYQYQLGGLPGGVSGAFIYLFDKDFSDLSDTTPVPPPPGWEGSTKDYSWIAGGSFWQYISTDEAHEGPLNLTNRQQDLAGWGIFGRLTLADHNTNPWKTSVALGLGARGVIPSRPNDMFGVGYFYNGLSKKGFIEKVENGQGVEGYYNLAIVPSVRLSFNLQWIKSFTPKIDIIHFDDAWVFST